MKTEPSQPPSLWAKLAILTVNSLADKIAGRIDLPDSLGHPGHHLPPQPPTQPSRQKL